MKEQERKQIMEQEELKKECLEYFRARQVYQKLFEGMRKKYAGLGRLGGTVTLTGLTREERHQLGGFFQKDYTENKTVTISGRLMEKALFSSRFAGISWEEILEAYFGQPLEVTKEQKIQADKEREAFFQRYHQFIQELESVKARQQLISHRIGEKLTRDKVRMLLRNPSASSRKYKEAWERLKNHRKLDNT